MKIFISYFAILLPMIILDGIWLLFIAKQFYQKHIGFLIGSSVNFTPVLFFYPLYSFGTLLLVVMPAIEAGSWVEALWRGALMGFIAYAAYDLTNQATISGWPTVVTIVDILWGTVVTSAVSVIAFFVITHFN